MKTRLNTALLGSALALLALAAPARADELDAIKSRGTLVCGVGSNYIPFSYVEDQQTRKMVGYDVDLCEAVARKIGVKPDFKFITAATRVPEVQQGRVDVVLASVTITPEREQLISFSYPHLVNGTSVITPAGKPIKAFSDLDGKRVAVTEGGTTGPAVSRVIPGARPIGFPTPATAFMALSQGKVQAMAADETALVGLMRAEPGKFVMFDQHLVTEKMGIGVRKDQPQLLAVVNQTLLDLEKSGQAQAIWDRWFGADSPLKRPRTFKFEAPAGGN